MVLTAEQKSIIYQGLAYSFQKADFPDYTVECYEDRIFLHIPYQIKGNNFYAQVFIIETENYEGNSPTEDVQASLFVCSDELIFFIRLENHELILSDMTSSDFDMLAERWVMMIDHYFSKMQENIGCYRFGGSPLNILNYLIITQPFTGAVKSASKS